MTDESEIKELIKSAESFGARVVRKRDEQAFRCEGWDITESITVTGIPGFGPYPMPAIFAAERLREFVNGQNVRNFRRDDIPVEVIHCDPWRREVFPNFAEARKVYPDLDLHRSTARFTWAMRGEDPKTGKTMARFEAWEAYRMFSS